MYKCVFYIALVIFANYIQNILANQKNINPRLEVGPRSNKSDDIFIWYNTKNQTNIDQWVQIINNFTANTDVDSKTYEDCRPLNSYGYKTTSPCVFLKLNAVNGWKPDYYDDPKTLPGFIPQELKQHITNLKGNKKTASQTKQVWVTCSGTSRVDVVNIGGFEYFPTQGFPEKYFTSTNENGDVIPIIAVRIKNPMKNIIVSVECRLWAKNINYSHEQLDAYVTFELLVDDF